MPFTSWKKNISPTRNERIPKIFSTESSATHGNHSHLLLDKPVHKTQKEHELWGQPSPPRGIETYTCTVRQWPSACPHVRAHSAVSFHLLSKGSEVTHGNFALGRDTWGRVLFNGNYHSITLSFRKCWILVLLCTHSPFRKFQLKVTTSHFEFAVN